ncbi:hypothetical protein [Pseudofulvibacter geojedonensis]|uniref:DUF304 domain-containing protein n=1 Tax=Pseudofulvibacter geojedonensis TaxID=1123758 RepID=A0ABW3HY85_9FLAO
MKFSNEKKITKYKLTYGLLIGILIGYYLYKVIVLNDSISNIDSIILVVSLLLLLIYWHQKATYFEYDSTGLGLVIIRKGILLSEYNNYREQRIEIPKTKLYKFGYSNYFFSKKIHLYIKSNNTVKKTSVDVTLLSNKKIKALKASLNKVVRENSSI